MGVGPWPKNHLSRSSGAGLPVVSRLPKSSQSLDVKEAQRRSGAMLAVKIRRLTLISLAPDEDAHHDKL